LEGIKDALMEEYLSNVAGKMAGMMIQKERRRKK
jgi:hypothetical protein